MGILLVFMFRLTWGLFAFCSLVHATGDSASSGQGTSSDPLIDLIFNGQRPTCHTEIIPESELRKPYLGGAYPGSACPQQPSTDNVDIILPGNDERIIYNQCGVYMSKAGAYVCQDCVKAFPPGPKCFYIFEAPTRGYITVNLELKTLVAPEDTASLMIFEGYGGRNVYKRRLTAPETLTLKPSGASLMIELHVTGQVKPEISFSIVFTINGNYMVPTSGCGGIVRDFGTVSSPGFPSATKYYENCIWLFYAPEHSKAYVDITTMTLTKEGERFGRLVIRDGHEGTDPIIEMVYGNTGKKVVGTKSKLFLQYETTNSEHSSAGFEASFGYQLQGRS